MQPGSEVDSFNNVAYNNKVADLQAQLSGLVVQNEALDSLMVATQSLISDSSMFDTDTLVQMDTSRMEPVAVVHTSVVAINEKTVTDTLKSDTASAPDMVQTSLTDSLVNQPDTVEIQNEALATNEPQDRQSQASDSLINNHAQDTSKVSGSLLTASGRKDGFSPQQEDSLSNKVINQGSKDLLTGNIVVMPVVNKNTKDTIAEGMASNQKDTAVLQSHITSLKDSLDNEPAIGKSSNSLLTVSNGKDSSQVQHRDSLNNFKTNSNQTSKGFRTGNTTIVPVINKAGKDNITEGSNKSNEDIIILQARIKALEDSLANKNMLPQGSKQIPKGNTAVVPVVNKTAKDTLSANQQEAKEDITALHNRISKLEDSLKNNTAVNKDVNRLLITSDPAGISQQPAKDTTRNKPNVPDVSKDKPTTPDNDEVIRLRAELADLQKEKESLMQQLDKPAAAPVSKPQKTTQISGNENVATQDDIDALKSEIQSLKGTINSNGNSRGVAPQRSLLPPIVPAIGIGVGGKNKVEKIIEHDTIFVERPVDTTNFIDTVRLIDTVMIRDTIRVSDTINKILRDTVQQTLVKDSVITVTNIVDKQKENLLTLPPFVILFDLGKSDVKLVYRKRLDYYAAQLKKYNDLKIVITGHTDKTGSVANNLILSEKRAKSISGYLIGKGVGSDAMQLNGLGEAAPIVENDTKEGQSQNRRVELIFKEK